MHFGPYTREWCGRKHLDTIHFSMVQNVRNNHPFIHVWIICLYSAAKISFFLALTISGHFYPFLIISHLSGSLSPQPPFKAYFPIPAAAEGQFLQVESLAWEVVNRWTCCRDRIDRTLLGQLYKMWIWTYNHGTHQGNEKDMRLPLRLFHEKPCNSNFGLLVGTTSGSLASLEILRRTKSDDLFGVFGVSFSFRICVQHESFQSPNTNDTAPEKPE